MTFDLQCREVYSGRNLTLLSYYSAFIIFSEKDTPGINEKNTLREMLSSPVEEKIGTVSPEANEHAD